MIVNARQIIKKALISGLQNRGGSYPSGCTIDYRGNADVIVDGRQYIVQGVANKGYWLDKMWITAGDGYAVIKTDGYKPLVITTLPCAVRDEMEMQKLQEDWEVIK